MGLARLRDGSRAYEAAAGHAERALAIARGQGLRLVECRAHHALATLCRALGDPERAGRHASRARHIRAETGFRPARLG